MYCRVRSWNCETREHTIAYHAAIYFQLVQWFEQFRENVCWRVDECGWVWMSVNACVHAPTHIHTSTHIHTHPHSSTLLQTWPHHVTQHTPYSIHLHPFSMPGNVYVFGHSDLLMCAVKWGWEHMAGRCVMALFGDFLWKMLDSRIHKIYINGKLKFSALKQFLFPLAV